MAEAGGEAEAAVVDAEVEAESEDSEAEDEEEEVEERVSVHEDKQSRSFRFRFDSFATLPVTAEVKSPVFFCFGRRWGLTLYPGGFRSVPVPGHNQPAATEDEWISMWLWPAPPSADEDEEGGEMGHGQEMGGEMRVRLDARVLNTDGEAIYWADDPDGLATTKYRGRGPVNGGGWTRFLGTHAYVADPTGEFLASDGSLIILLRMELVEESGGPFAPPNPFAQQMKKLFLDEDTSDVVFAVERDGNEGPVHFHAHRVVLKLCASSLEDLCGSFSGGTVIPITRVEPSVFKLLLFYIYGGDISTEDWRLHSKKLIDAADLYGLVYLKLEAELKYVEYTKVSVENVVDCLVYAESKQCAYLKEVVMDFVVENQREVLQTVASSRDIPQSSTMFTDLLAAVDRMRAGAAGEAGSLETMRVGALRRSLHEKGLDVDGSRETLVSRLKESNAKVGDKRGRAD